MNEPIIHARLLWKAFRAGVQSRISNGVGMEATPDFTCVRFSFPRMTQAEYSEVYDFLLWECHRYDTLDIYTFGTSHIFQVFPSLGVVAEAKANHPKGVDLSVPPYAKDFFLGVPR